MKLLGLNFLLTTTQVLSTRKNDLMSVIVLMVQKSVVPSVIQGLLGRWMHQVVQLRKYRRNLLHFHLHYLLDLGVPKDESTMDNWYCIARDQHPDKTIHMGQLELGPTNSHHN
ncbi:MAG: hypothetical protein A2Z16_01850 [Chloroflexi bacterium RBG_16_54_18]|nr:MAG: hypothetical protein A2Z16_01850 [Chloroflexi bacterium RBG_16_54_18]